MPRTCLCGEVIPPEDTYGPVSNTYLKWYENSKNFGDPDSRKKFYLCRNHTNELVEYLDAVASGDDVAVVRSLDATGSSSH